MMQESTDDIARRYDKMIEEKTEGESLVSIKARVKKNADVVYSTRYSKDEIALIRKAAQKRGLPPSAFIRTAALAAAAGELDLAAARKVAVVQEVQAKARDLAEAASKL
ncbi:MAG: hypothetical protein GEU75_03540 [Dehalococcoidia bacterium]|nr:hypothetical protein [Dehalococcoidia bacterium]